MPIWHKITVDDVKKKWPFMADILAASSDEGVSTIADRIVSKIETGRGVYKAANLYSISDRWRCYGTEEYKKPSDHSTMNKMLLEKSIFFDCNSLPSESKLTIAF